MRNFLTALVETADFPRRWDSGPWTASHGWVAIISDVAIFVAYAAIPALLGHLAVRRKNLPFPPVFWLFAACLLLCAASHLLDAILAWTPGDRFSGLIKVFTAVASWAAFLVLVRIVQRASAIPGLKGANESMLFESRDLRLAEDRFRIVVESVPNGIDMIILD